MGAGGDAPSVPLWDMAVLVGATLFISTVVILVWTQPDTYDLDGPQEVLTIHTGLSQAGLTFESTCIVNPVSESGDPPPSCGDLTVWIVPHDGAESWDGRLDDGTNVILLDGENSESQVELNGKLDSGEYRLILDGDGQYTFEVTVNRAIPHEFLPAIIGAVLMIWGIWRKQQEDEAV
jgi:hypothetical protein